MAQFRNATKLALTAKLISIRGSGGMTLVMIMTQSRRSLLFLRPRSTPFAHTYQLAARTKMGRNPMKRKRLEVVGTLCERTGLALCRSRCEERPQDNHHRAHTQALPSSIAAEHSCTCHRRRDVHPSPTARLIPSGEPSIHPRARLN